MKASERQRSKNRENMRRRYYLRKEKGICMFCSYPAEKGHIRCKDHRELTREHSAGMRDIRKVKGVCADCGRCPPSSGFVSCENCREKWKTCRNSSRLQDREF